MDISLIIPVFNEERSLMPLYKRIKEVLKGPYEIIFIDDGSTDKTFVELNKLSDIKIIRFRKNFGQTAALDAGIKHAKGKIIITLDGDLQNDPADIPRLLEKLKEGYDCVSGWRIKRKDSYVKLLTSILANKLRRLLINDQVHDSGCTLKAYKKECFENLDLYGEMHRYLPALLSLRGFKIGEIKVRHHQRKFGKSKYRSSRLIRGFLDLITVWFWMKFQARPLHLFGSFGIFFALLGLFGGMYALIAKLFFNQDLSSNFLAIASMILFLLGINFFISGLTADISIGK